MTIPRSAFLRLSGCALVANAARRLAAAIRPRRWAMVVDIRKCARRPNCALCVDACHQAHNVPSIPDPRHEVRWIAKQPFDRVFRDEADAYSPDRLAPAMILCNHCDNPPCVRVCPTQATFRRDDGIVAMDWHRCIGCRYCMAACPYGSRSFNWQDPRPYIKRPAPDYPTRAKGVVEKCTFCVERAAAARAPACVDACPEKALVFGDLADPQSSVRALLGSRAHVRRKTWLGTRPQVYYIG